MSSFLKTASKQVTDAKTFLREAAGGNTIKYSAEKGSKHLIYIPFVQQEEVDEATQQKVMKKRIIAISGEVHDWTGSDGKYKATICAKGSVRMADDGTTMLNDGSCPFCDRVSDSWDIYHYREELEEQTCQLTGEQRKNHMDRTLQAFRNEMKTKAAKPCMYILVIKFKLDDKGVPVMGADQIPEYDLKVMKLSASRVEKIQQQIANSGGDLPGSEIIFEYPNVDDIRLLYSQSTTTPVFPANMLTGKYPDLLNSINNAVSKFEWDGIEKAFPEWQGMTTADANNTVNSMFEQWDRYVKELKTNPQAKYLEYVVQSPATKPSLEGAAGMTMPTVPEIQTGAMPTMPTIPTVPGAIPGATTGAPVGLTPPTVPTAPQAPEMPQIPTPPQPQAQAQGNTDPNSVFAGAAPTAPTVSV